jgi:hypothetical protein
MAMHENVLISIWQEISINGAIFWSVNSNKRFLQSSPSITIGNHQCNGAAPLLVAGGINND